MSGGSNGTTVVAASGKVRSMRVPLLVHTLPYMCNGCHMMLEQGAPNSGRCSYVSPDCTSLVDGCAVPV